MSLKTYLRKRNFANTPEPETSMTKKRGGKGPRFVIQKHDASSLHYDFRLEIDDALKSWAVPKGPSVKPGDKRLAVPVEDHPLDYADFEGVIPSGEYGAGVVMVWDRGWFENSNRDRDDKPLSLHKAWARGKLEFVLHGEKLQGAFALIRSRSGAMKGKWLLTKMKDEHADGRRNPVSSQPRSVLSGRTMQQIKRDEAENGE